MPAAIVSLRLTYSVTHKDQYGNNIVNTEFDTSFSAVVQQAGADAEEHQGTLPALAPIELLMKAVCLALYSYLLIFTHSRVIFIYITSTLSPVFSKHYNAGTYIDLHPCRTTQLSRR